MRSVFLSAILGLYSLGCESKSDHGFVTVGGEHGEVAASSAVDAWGDCKAEGVTGVGSEAVVQTIPPPEAGNVSVHTPIIAFLEAGYTRADIEDFEVTSNGWGIDGEMVSFERRGTTVVGFAPLDPYDVAGEVIIRMNIAGDSARWQFHTGPYEDTVAGNPNLSFESPSTTQGTPCQYTYFTDNFIGFGDVAITEESAGATDATDGKSRLLMSTGEVLGNAAVGSTSSYVTSQPFPMVSAANLRFDFRFVSEEFTDFDGDIYDDSFLVMVHGQQGVVFEEISSVSRVGIDGAHPMPFPGMVDAQAAEWRTHTLSRFNSVGSNATISFFLSDVGDPSRTTAVSVDNLRVE